MRLNRFSFSQPTCAATMDTTKPFECGGPIEVHKAKRALTGRTYFYCGCAACKVGIADDDRAVVQAVVDAHNAKVVA